MVKFDHPLGIAVPNSFVRIRNVALARRPFAEYDSAAILIDAFWRVIDADGGKMPSRQQVVDQLSKTK